MCDLNIIGHYVIIPLVLFLSTYLVSLHACSTYQGLQFDFNLALTIKIKNCLDDIQELMGLLTIK